MKTRTINFKNKSSVFWKYFTENTTDTRCMRNTANFYIRNTMTGIRKSPEERTALETEVLHDVFTGIQKANREAEERFLSKLERLVKSGGMKSAVRRSRLVQTVFSYPTKDKWFLNYETLDAIFKETKHPVYRRMNSQVNQNAIRKTVKSWVGYFESMKEYAVCPEKFLGKPKLPGYIRNKQATAWWTKQTARLTFQAGKAYKGQCMNYLYKTTESVNIQDWYLSYKERRNLRRHTCSRISKVRHGNRSERRAELMKAFGGTRKVWTPVKTAA